MVFNKILETAGAMSPIELANPPQPKSTAPATPVPKTSISYKDLAPDLQAQLAAQAGLKTQEAVPAA